MDALADSAFSAGLRASLWIYPLVNTGHIVGIALLFGAIVPLDLRLLGLWRGVPLDALTRVLVPVAIGGVSLALPTGLVLFSARPLEYIAEPLFLIKMGLLTAALGNALAFRLGGRAPRLAALGSIVLWLAVITVGRLIGYR